MYGQSRSPHSLLQRGADHRRKRMKVLLIIPSYNEEKNIKTVYDSICASNAENAFGYQHIFINDGSQDNTEQELEKCGANYITLVENLGIGGAVQTGYKYAYENGYDIAVQMDGDGQHDVRSVQNIIDPLLNNEADLVIGSRFIKGSSSEFKSSFFRRIGIKIISLVIKMKTGKKIFDTTSGFRAINRKMLKAFSHDYPTEYPEPISSTLALKSGFRIKEIPVAMHERVEGVSSIRAWKTLYYMVNVILSIAFLHAPRRKR